MVTITVDASGKATAIDSAGRSVKPNTVVSAGGGTWSYGSAADGIWKGCWSDYVHPTDEHSATAIIGPNEDKEYNSANNWADAQADSGWAQTCYAYWDTY